MFYFYHKIVFSFKKNLCEEISTNNLLLWLLICYADNYSLILLLPLERLLKFAMLDSLLIKHGFRKCLSATPTKRSQKMHWLFNHKNYVQQLTYTHFDTIIIGDSIAAGLSRYSNIWETFFKESLNLGIGGDRTQHSGGWSVCLFQATSNTSSFTAVPTILVRIVPVKLRIAFYTLPYCS